jgi:hypothetical protein
MATIPLALIYAKRAFQESINSKWISSFETHSTASCVLPFSFFIVYFLAFFILCIHSQLALALNILGSKKQKQNRKE